MLQELLYPLFSVVFWQKEMGLSPLRDAYAQSWSAMLSLYTVASMIIVFLMFTVIYLSLVCVPRFTRGKQYLTCYALMLVIVFLVFTGGMPASWNIGGAVIKVVALLCAGFAARAAQDFLSRNKAMSVLLWVVQCACFLLMYIVPMLLPIP